MTDVLSDSIKSSVTEQIPMKKFGETQDIANAVAFLASEDAKYITGQVLCVERRHGNVEKDRSVSV